MAEMGTDPDLEPDSESKIWRLTGSGTEKCSAHLSRVVTVEIWIRWEN